MKLKFLLSLAFLVALGSCTMQKRQHLPGYYVQWNHHKVSSHKAERVALEPQRDKVKPETEKIENGLVAFKEASVVVSKRNLVSDNNGATVGVDYQRTGSVQHEVPLDISMTERVMKGDKYTAAKPERRKSQRKSADKFLFITTALMGLTSLGFIAWKRKTSLKLTSWASRSASKAQGLITALHLALVGSSLYAGFNLGEMGYSISDASGVAFSALAMGGLLVAPILARKGELVLPRTLQKRRLGYISAMLGTTMLTLMAGNQISTAGPESAFHETFSNIDNKVMSAATFGDFSSEGQVDSDQYRTTRSAVNAGLCAAGILLTILLSLLVCAGACLIAFGVGIPLTGGALSALLLIPAGILLGAGAVYGIIAALKWCAPQSQEENE